jgi:hypothetical protein
MIVAIKIFGDQIFGAVRNNFESYLKQLVIWSIMAIDPTIELFLSLPKKIQVPICGHQLE